MVIALIPLAIIIDFALLYVSFPNATEYIGIIDFPIAVTIVGALIFARRRRRANGEKVTIPQTTPLDKLKQRNGGRRAPTQAKSILDQDEEEEAEVFMGTPDFEKKARNIDEIMQRMKARDLNLGAGPGREVEAPPQPLPEEPEPSATPTSGKETDSKRKLKDYVLSPEKLKIPAFVCRCGHAHRFVCLTCGLTVEQAVKKNKTHWVEWVPSTGALP